MKDKTKIKGFLTDRARELCAFTIFIVALLLAVSMFTYSGLDSASQTNAVGRCGAFVSYALYQFFGFGFYFLIAFCLLLSIVVFRAKEWLTIKQLIFRGVVFLVGVCAASGLFTMLRKDPIRGLDISSGGGFVGDGICGVMKMAFGDIGTTIILTANTH